MADPAHMELLSVTALDGSSSAVVLAAELFAFYQFAIQ